MVHKGELSMINRVGYTDNKTSFSAYIKPDKSGYLDKLYNVTTGAFGDSNIGEVINLAKELRLNAPKHELEIISLSEGTTQRAVVRNNSTGSIASFETKDGLYELLPNMLKNLNEMAMRNVAFWSENNKSARLYRLLTGQKDNSITKI